ncbi:hypothetical protein F5883DRAFT_544054 [Diaporthe sp. PMI_573]|nr:hypothetical protein F5883DRAFT_544054 [Diaporthaceae sp. PMI_573]
MKLSSIASVALLQLSGALAQEWAPPSGAITWDNLEHIRLYAVDPQGNLREWQYDGSTWGGNAWVGSTVTAVNDGSRLRVYYKHTSGRIMERVYENGWRDGAMLP